MRLSARLLRGSAAAVATLMAATVIAPATSLADSDTVSSASTSASAPDLSTQQLSLARSIAQARDLNDANAVRAAAAPSVQGTTSPTLAVRTSAPGVGAASLAADGQCMDQAGACNTAIAFMVAQMNSHAYWHSRCLALVSAAYGDRYANIPRAVDAGLAMQASGKMFITKDYKQIPRGAVLWWQSRPGQGSDAGHVAISIGGGMAISSDAPNDDGTVGVVPIEFFEKNWQKIFLGYSLP